MRDEIREQPDVLARLVERGRDGVEAAGVAIRAADPEFVVIAAHGTSDHAATYAQYVFGIRHGLATSLASPSIVSLYGAPLRFERALVIGISQSGASPDVAAVVGHGRRRGTLTLAITNDPLSAVARAAERVLPLRAGPERAIAATKTYTAELTVLAMLSAALGGEAVDWSALAGLGPAVGQALETEDEARRIALDQANLARAFVLGRGYGYATAREWALKLKELTYLAADPYSTADFMHGPLALVSPGRTTWTRSSSGSSATTASRSWCSPIGHRRARRRRGHCRPRRACRNGSRRSRRSCRRSCTRCTWRSRAASIQMWRARSRRSR